MKTQLTTKFYLPKWSMYVLLSFFVFLFNVPTALPQQRVPVQSEQRSEPRAIKKQFHFVKYYQPVCRENFYSEPEFLSFLFSRSRLIQIERENEEDRVLTFIQIGINLIANSLPRSEEDILFSNQG